MKSCPPNFTTHHLDATNELWIGRLPDRLMPTTDDFNAVWQTHPLDFHTIRMFGKLIKTPRWQQAYGKDYQYTSRVNLALPIPLALEPFLNWSRENVDSNLNGLLLNWYDGGLGHYIGAHKDSLANLIPETPIVTISFGGERIFRLRRGKTIMTDIPVRNGDAIVMPWKTNLAFTHEVLRANRHCGRRISITVRAFV